MLRTSKRGAPQGLRSRPERAGRLKSKNQCAEDKSHALRPGDASSAFQNIAFQDGRKSSNVVSGRQRPEVTSKTSKSGRKIQFDRGNCWRVTMRLRLVRRNRSANLEERPEERTKSPTSDDCATWNTVNSRNSKSQQPKTETEAKNTIQSMPN